MHRRDFFVTYSAAGLSFLDPLCLPCRRMEWKDEYHGPTQRWDGSPLWGTFEERMRYAPTLLGRRNRAIQWHGNPNRKKMKALPRVRLNTKTGTLILQDARLPCDKRMAYATV